VGGKNYFMQNLVNFQVPVRNMSLEIPFYPSFRMKNLADCGYPCPCGYANDPVRPCTCSSSTVTKYQKRISGPMLDRIDIHIEVPRVDYEKLSGDRLGEMSATIRQRVQAARQRQLERFAGMNIVCNADMRVAEVRKFCKLDETGDSLVRTAMSQMNLSARAYHRTLKLARTIADLAGNDQIQTQHVAEALQYRPKGMIG
jgi:magnesium chelatase family protein